MKENGIQNCPRNFGLYGFSDIYTISGKGTMLIAVHGFIEDDQVLGNLLRKTVSWFDILCLKLSQSQFSLCKELNFPLSVIKCELDTHFQNEKSANSIVSIISFIYSTRGGVYDADAKCSQVICYSHIILRAPYDFHLRQHAESNRTVAGSNSGTAR